MFNISDDDIFDFGEDFLQNAFKISPQKTPKEQDFEIKNLSLRNSGLSKENHILNIQSDNIEKNELPVLKDKTDFNVLQDDENDHSRIEHISSPKNTKLKAIRSKCDQLAFDLVPGSSKEVTSEISDLKSKNQRVKGFKKQLPFILPSSNDDLDSLFDFELNDFKTQGHQQKGEHLSGVPESNQYESKIYSIGENIKSITKNPSCSSLTNIYQFSDERRKFCKLTEEKNNCNLFRKGLPSRNSNLSVLPSAVSISRKSSTESSFTPSKVGVEFPITTKTAKDKYVTNLRTCEEQRKRVSPTSSSPICNKPSHNESFKTRKRKFPGPAGILPKLPAGADLPSPSQPESPIAIVESKVHRQEDFPCSQASIEEFQKPPWLNMLKDLDCKPDDANSLLDRFNIAWVLQQAAAKQLPRGKVPVLCVIIKVITYEGSEASVVFKDKTGEISGTVHRKLLEEYQQNIEPGAVLVLKQVSVFSPSTRKHYLNVTPNNIVSMYGILGAKTSIIDCSGHQLAAMGEEWMLEAALLNAGNKSKMSSPFSTNKYSPLCTPQTSNTTISRMNSGVQVKPGKLSEAKLHGPTENKGKNIIPQKHSFASTSFIPNNGTKKSYTNVQNNMTRKELQNSFLTSNIGDSNAVQSQTQSSPAYSAAGIKSTDLDVFNNVDINNREVNIGTLRSSETCIGKGLPSKCVDTVAVPSMDDMENELFEDDLDSLLLTIDDKLF